MRKPEEKRQLGKPRRRYIGIKSRMRWAGHVARMGEVRGVYRFLVGKPEERRQLGRPRRRYMIYLLTAIGLTPAGSGTVHIYTQTIHRTT